MPLYAVLLDERDLPIDRVYAEDEEDARIRVAERTGISSLDLVAEEMD